MNTKRIEAVARLCHELNRQICEIGGDYSQLPWDLAPDIIKQSAMTGVQSHMNNPDLTPEESHSLWMDYKLKEGWVYGEVKSVEAKTHPLLIPYEQLDPMDRLKDSIFSTAVKYTLEI